MFVACSTLCFGRHTLPEALRTISEMGFNKVDVAVREDGPHLRPSEVTSDIGRAVRQLRTGQGLTVAALHLEPAPGLSGDDFAEQVKAVCRLARVLTTPLVSIPAAAVGTDVGVEVERLTLLSRLAAFRRRCAHRGNADGNTDGRPGLHRGTVPKSAGAWHCPGSEPLPDQCP